jgi:hypothetical protein
VSVVLVDMVNPQKQDLMLGKRKNYLLILNFFINFYSKIFKTIIVLPELFLACGVAGAVKRDRLRTY